MEKELLSSEAFESSNSLRRFVDGVMKNIISMILDNLHDYSWFQYYKLISLRILKTQRF